jgi:predicted nucleic acid-binding protein
VIAARTVTIDTSVWVPFLRSREHARTVEPLIAAGRVWVHSIVLLELYAGTHSPADGWALDGIRLAAESLGRFYHPSAEDLRLAGRVLSYWSRRYGVVRPRDHSRDLLIAIGAARTKSVLLTANGRDMRRWARALAERARLRVPVAVPAG